MSACRTRALTRADLDTHADSSLAQVDRIKRSHTFTVGCSSCSCGAHLSILSISTTSVRTSGASSVCLAVRFTLRQLMGGCGHVGWVRNISTSLLLRVPSRHHPCVLTTTLRCSRRFSSDHHRGAVHQWRHIRQRPRQRPRRARIRKCEVAACDASARVQCEATVNGAASASWSLSDNLRQVQKPPPPV